MIPSPYSRNEVASVELTPAIIDRARGALLGAAVGDALGVPYEFVAAPNGEPEMKGGGLGPYEPGEWSDDTQMSVLTARVAATGLPLASRKALIRVGDALIDWMSFGASDMGTQTRAVLALAASGKSGDTVERLTSAARTFSEENQRPSGNAALSRISPAGLAYLGSRERTAQAAESLTRLTHYDRLADEASILWAEAIRNAVVTGKINIFGGFDFLVEESATRWDRLLQDAEKSRYDANQNSRVQVAVQSAWDAVYSVRDLRGVEAVRAGLVRAVQIGGDTDSTASMAGALLGATYGESCIPAEWAAAVHGWPGLTGADYADLAEQMVRAAEEKNREYADGEDDGYDGD